MALSGKVKWFSNAKGYGFIEGEGQAQDIFVHYSSIVDEGYKSLDKGQAVTFEVVQSEKGPQANDITVID